MKIFNAIYKILIIFLLSISLQSCNVNSSPNEIWVVRDSNIADDFSMSMEIGCDFFNTNTGNNNNIKCIENKTYLKNDPDAIKKILVAASNEPKLLAIIGPPTSGDTIIAQQMAVPLSIPIFAPIATNTNISNNSSHNGMNNFFRLVATDEIQSREISKFIINKLNLKSTDATTKKNILIVYDDKEYGRDLARGIEKEVKQKEGIINNKEKKINAKTFYIEVKKIGVSEEDGGNLKRLKSTAPESYLKDVDLVVIAGYSDEAIEAVKYLHDSQYTQTILLTDGSYSNKFLEDV
jgi:ABC-type branched-subunit amino acid transport system substrate-binding protein